VTVDAVEIPALDMDRAYSRMGARGLWEIVAPTPKRPNISDQRTRFRIRTTPAGRESVLVFPVRTDVPYTIQSSPSLNGPWTTVTTGIGTEVVGTYISSLQSDDRVRFFRTLSN
jgi:hypothetical protein